MKTAFYAVDGKSQIVLTPETPIDEAAVEVIKGRDRAIGVFEGSFYDCNGGFTRQNSDRSIIITFSTKGQSECVS